VHSVEAIERCAESHNVHYDASEAITAKVSSGSLTIRFPDSSSVCRVLTDEGDDVISW